MENENTMHPELNNPKTEATQTMSEMMKDVNENHNNPIDGIKTEGLATPDAIVGASNGASELGPVSPESIDALTARIKSMADESFQARNEALAKASNGASELGPVSAEKAHEVASAAVEQSWNSNEARGIFEAILLHTSEVEIKYKNLGEVSNEVRDIYKETLGRVNNGLVALHAAA